MQPTIYAVGFGPGDVLHMTVITGAVSRQAVSFYANAAGD